MPKVDITITISVIVAICSIVSPIATTILNNIHNTKIKKMELKDKHYKRTILHIQGIYEEYLKSAGNIRMVPKDELLEQYSTYYLLALFHAPPDLQKQMIKVNRLIESRNWEEALSLLETLIPKLNATVQRL